MPHPPNSGFIRWSGIVPLILTAGICLWFIHLRLNMHLKESLEELGTTLNGAKVTFKDISISWISGAITLYGLEVTQPQSPQRNRLEINRVHLPFSWGAAVRGKGVFPDATLDGVMMDTPRKQSGAVPTPVSNPFLKLSPTVQAALDELNSKYSRSVLDSLPVLLEKFDPATEFIEQREQLKSPKYLKTLSEQLAQQQLRVKADLDTLPKSSDFLLIKARMNRTRVDALTSLDELQKILKEIESTYELASQKVQTTQEKSDQMTQTFQQLEDDILKLEQLIQEDSQWVASQLKLPTADLENISASLFGQDILSKVSHLQKLWHFWQAFQQNPREIFFTHPHERGQDFPFDTSTHLPWFWIQKLTLASGDRELRTAEILGTLTHLSSQSQGSKEFLNLDVKGHIPQNDIHHIRCTLTHPSSDPQDLYQLDVTIDRYPVLPLQLADTQALTLSATPQYASSTLQAQFSPTVFRFHWAQVFHATQFTFTSTVSDLHDAIAPVIDRLQEVTIKSDVTLSDTSSEFRVTSNLGSALQESLNGLIQEKLSEAQQKIREFVSAKIRTERHVVETQFAELQSNLQQTIAQRLREAKDTQALVQVKLDQILKQKSVLETQVSIPKRGVL